MTNTKLLLRLSLLFLFASQVPAQVSSAQQLSSAPAAKPQPGVQVVMTVLPSLGGTFTEGIAINESREVIGASSSNGENQNHAVLWPKKGQVTALGTLGGSDGQVVALNDRGDSAGSSLTAADFENHAVLWTRKGETIDLSRPGDWGEAFDLNNAGQVVGVEYPGCVAGDCRQAIAFSWTRATGTVLLGTLGGTYSFAFAVNDAGSIAGISYPSGDPGYHLFLWTPSAGMRDLGTLGGHESYVYAMNSLSHIVGWSQTPTETHAFLWTPKRGMIDLGTLGGKQSVAFAVNDHDQVVGMSSLAGEREWHGFSWTPSGGMIDIGVGASAVNNAGQVVAGNGVWTAADGWTWLGGGELSQSRFAINQAGDVVGRTSINGVTYAAIWRVIHRNR